MHDRIVAPNRILMFALLLGTFACSSSSPDAGGGTGGDSKRGGLTSGKGGDVGSATGGTTADSSGGAAAVDSGSPDAATSGPDAAINRGTGGARAAGAGGALAAGTGGARAAGAGGSAGSSSIGTGGGATAGSSGGIMRGPAPTVASASTKGPYTVKTYTSGFKDEPGFGKATIYYPTDADAPFGSVAICPGFTATQSSINAWGPFLASHGIVVMTIDTNSTTDSVDQRSTALLDALDSLKLENSRAGSPLMGKLDIMRTGLMGWSMGGGATWVDANKHPELKTAITLAGHIITASGGSAAITKIAVPTLMFAGQTDTPILGGGMSQPIYTQIPESVPKMLYEITGLGHDAGNDPANNGKNVGLYGLSWQKVFLEGDTRYRPFLLVKGPNASDFRTNLK
jgi:dienelactone hydrolase